MFFLDLRWKLIPSSKVSPEATLATDDETNNIRHRSYPTREKDRLCSKMYAEMRTKGRKHERIGVLVHWQPGAMQRFCSSVVHFGPHDLCQNILPNSNIWRSSNLDADFMVRLPRIHTCWPGWMPQQISFTYPCASAKRIIVSGHLSARITSKFCWSMHGTWFSPRWLMVINNNVFRQLEPPRLQLEERRSNSDSEYSSVSSVLSR